MKQLVDRLAGKMTKQQWKSEQLEDQEIGPVLRLMQEKKHLQYKDTEGRPPRNEDNSAFPRRFEVS